MGQGWPRLPSRHDWRPARASRLRCCCQGSRFWTGLRTGLLADGAEHRAAGAGSYCRLGSCKPATCHTFRRSFATHFLVQGADIRRIQELLGHSDVKATMINTYVLNLGRSDVRSAADML